MVDTYSKGADSRKLYKKNHGDGEDPIIIAQRFLNIFRQLHIFSTERKEAFNKMSYAERVKLYNEDKETYEKLTGGNQ